MVNWLTFIVSPWQIQHELISQAPGDTIAVKQVTVDFEVALWWALRSVLPEVEIRGCVLHWTQAVWRKVRRDCRFIWQLSCSTAKEEIGEDLNSVCNGLKRSYCLLLKGTLPILGKNYCVYFLPQVQEIGLQGPYTKDPGTYQWIRK